jgi:hypothetical protein
LLRLAEAGSTTVGVRLRELEAERERLAKELANVEHREAARRQLAAFDARHLQGWWEFSDAPEHQPELRENLHRFVEKVTLDPADDDLQVHYNIPGGIGWRGRRDSNPRPSGSKPDALSN